MNSLQTRLLACLLTLPTVVFAQHDETPLLGKCTVDDLKKEPYVEWFTEHYDKYAPDRNAVAQLRTVAWDDYEITVFFGVWCGDSRREMPRFIKLLDEAGCPSSRISLIAVSNADSLFKQSPAHEERNKHIYRVPTFIISKQGNEVNRIVEIPAGSLERDLLAIVGNNHYAPNYAAHTTLVRWLDEGLLADANLSIRGAAHTLRSQAQSAGDLYSMGYVLYQRGGEWLDAAINIFRINAILYPNTWETYLRLAHALHQKGDSNRALEALRTAMQQPNDVRQVKEMLELYDEIKNPHNNRP